MIDGYTSAMNRYLDEYDKENARQEKWREANYISDCPICGEPMYLTENYGEKKCIRDDDGEWVHEICWEMQDDDE